MIDPDAGALLAAVRNRAHSLRVSIHPTRTDRLRDLVVPSGIHAVGTHGFGLSADSSIDGYLSTDALADARHTLRVRDSGTGALPAHAAARRAQRLARLTPPDNHPPPPRPSQARDPRGISM